VLLIGGIVPNRDRRDRATWWSPKSGQVVIGEMEPLCDRRNEATSWSSKWSHLNPWVLGKNPKASRTS